MQHIPWSDGRLVDDAGAASFVTSTGSVVAWSLGEVMIDSVLTPVPTSVPSWQIDELEYAVTVGSLGISVRHTMDQTWTIRLAVTNTGDSEVSVDVLRLVVAPGPDWTGWAVRAGAEGSVAVLSRQPSAPVYGFTLLQGELRGQGTEVEAGGFTLPAGGQRVTRLRGERYGSASEFARGRHEILPEWGWLDGGGHCALHHPDLAVVGQPDVSDADGVTELEGEPGDWRRLVLAGPRGLVEVELGFAPPLDDLVERFVAQGGDRWPVGRQSIMINSVASGLVVQRRLSSGTGGGRPRSDWEEALDGLCARVDESESMLAVALLARQSITTGDPELALRASAGLHDLGSAPGAALVLPEVVGACQLVGVDPHLTRGSSPGEPGEPGDPAEQLERCLLSGANPAEPFQALGAHWGLGLRGSALAADRAGRDSYALAVGRLLLAVAPPRLRGWACGPGELLDRHDRRIRYQLGVALESDRVVDEALAWLLLGPGGTD